LYFVTKFLSLCQRYMCTTIAHARRTLCCAVKQLIKKLLMKFNITNHNNNTLHMYADSTTDTYVSCTFNTVLSKVTKRSLT